MEMTPVAQPKGRKPWYQRIGSWLGLRAKLDALEKRKISCPCAGIQAMVCPTLEVQQSQYTHF